MPTIYNWIIFSGFETGNRQLSASQLHLLLNPTEEGEDESLRNSDEIVSSNKIHLFKRLSENIPHFNSPSKRIPSDMKPFQKYISFRFFKSMSSIFKMIISIFPDELHFQLKLGP